MIEREFAGAIRSFELLPADRLKLYRGLEADIGGLSDLAIRVGLKKPINSADAAHILSHALSQGHPIGLIKARNLVAEEMRKTPLGELQTLVVDIIADAYAGASDGG